MRKLAITILSLFSVVAVFSAVYPGTRLQNALRVNNDTTDTNTTSVAVTVAAKTNLRAGVITATNSITVGQSGETGVLELSSTNGTYTITFTVDANGGLVVKYGTTNMLTLQNGSSALHGGGGTRFLSDDGSFKPVTSTGSFAATNDFYAYANSYLSNFFAWNGVITNNLTVYGNTYLSNLHALYGYITNNFYVYGNSHHSNLYAFNATVTNNLIGYGNNYFSNLYTHNLTFSNNISGTIDPTQSGLTVKQRRSLKLQYPRRIDNAGCTYSNTNDYSAERFMIPLFSGTAATNANYARYAFMCPADLDTSVDLTARIAEELSGADTGARNYHAGVVSVANSSAANGTAANFVVVAGITDASGGSGDSETSTSETTLTDWRSNMTPGRWTVVELRRDGANDGSTVASYINELEIFYTSTQ